MVEDAVLEEDIDSEEENSVAEEVAADSAKEEEELIVREVLINTSYSLKSINQLSHHPFKQRSSI